MPSGSTAAQAAQAKPPISRGNLPHKLAAATANPPIESSPDYDESHSDSCIPCCLIPVVPIVVYAAILLFAPDNDGGNPASALNATR